MPERDDRVADAENGQSGFERPTPILAGAEVPRSLAELAATFVSLPLLGLAPRGRGEPVLVLPGLAVGDRSTTPLRFLLAQHGYAAYGWGLGRNTGPTLRVRDGLLEMLRDLADEHGQRVSLIGWSLGGIYARELAKARPDLVRQVITMGSPHRLRPEERIRSNARRTEWERVPVTAVYSRSDGVVPWRACLEDDAPFRENIEVFGSHVGYGHNPVVLWLIADRLAQPEDEWTPSRERPFAGGAIAS